MPHEPSPPVLLAEHSHLHVMVTGAGGFVGRALIPLLARQGHRIARWPSAEAAFDFGNESEYARWIEQLRGLDVVVHLAAHVHQLNAVLANDLRAQSINCDGSLRLARAALAAGVKRFIFISTAKVFGEGEHGPYHFDSIAAPQDAYARSKWEAEQGLRQLTAGTTLELVIIRPPLVYGPTAGANFARLQQLARLPLPLPINTIHNRRDMIGIDNLIDFIALCARSPVAVGTWLCSDGAAYSLGQVVSTLRRARGMPPLLFSAPASWVARAVECALGQANARRLLDNFELDIGATRTLLHWSPPHTMLTIMQKPAAAD